MAWHVERMDECASTMDEALARARDGAPDGTVVVAKRMTAGRGQHGHHWYSPEGGLYLSMVLRDVQDPRFLTLALGNAVADVLEVAGVDPGVKWVNDVLVGDRKIAGVLAEAESIGDRIDFIVAGIGVNVNGKRAELPADLRGLATTLEEELGVDQCIPDLESFLLEAAAGWIDKVRRGDTDAVLETWRRRDALAGRRVRVTESGEDVAGTAEGVDDAGHLVVAAPDGTHTVAQGSVLLL